MSYAWRLISSDLIWNCRKGDILDEKHVLQLKGIFLHFDEDKDGVLSVDELEGALSHLGFSTREKFVNKFCGNQEKMKIQGLHKRSFRTDFKTFVIVISKELKTLQQLERDLTALFAFMDVGRTGHLTRRDLRHLLVEVSTPMQLTPEEFTKFMRSLRFKDKVNIEELKRQLVFMY